MHYANNTELSSPEGTRGQFNGRPSVIKLGIDVHQEFYVVVVQEGGAIPSRRSGWPKAPSSSGRRSCGGAIRKRRSTRSTKRAGSVLDCKGS